MKRYIKAYMLKDSDMVVLNKEDIKNAKEEDFEEISLIFREEDMKINYKVNWQRKDRKTKEEVYAYLFKTKDGALNKIKELKESKECENVKLFKCIILKEEIK